MKVCNVASLQVCDIQGGLYYFAFDPEDQLIGTAEVQFTDNFENLDLSDFDFDGNAWFWAWQDEHGAQALHNNYYSEFCKVVADITETGVVLKD